MEVSEVIEDLDELEKIKYAKVFQTKDGESCIGIHDSRINPSCHVCKKQNATEQDLERPISSDHPQKLINCNICDKEIAKTDLKNYGT